MDAQTEFGIIEMGANHPLEIEFLCSIANPDYGYITNFGKLTWKASEAWMELLKLKLNFIRIYRKDIN